MLFTGRCPQWRYSLAGARNGAILWQVPTMALSSGRCPEWHYPADTQHNRVIVTACLWFLAGIGHPGGLQVPCFAMTQEEGISSSLSGRFVCLYGCSKDHQRTWQQSHRAGERGQRLWKMRLSCVVLETGNLEPMRSGKI